MSRTRPQQLVVSLAALLALINSGCLFRHHKNTNPLAAVQSSQPDKVLFDRSMHDIDRGKYTVARLSLQALINAYPDSEYLARAKMAIADSWYREGGSEGLAQAEAEYKDFITFFPTMKEASEAQLKIADIHFRQLEKPDRDPTHAVRAEQELRTFLINYPDSPLADKARQQLRDVQEVLAERQFRIGKFYYLRENYRAAQDRLKEVVERYPLYSNGGEAQELLARSFLITASRYDQAAANTPNQHFRELFKKNADADRADARKSLTTLIERYPVTGNVKWAEKELTTLHAPIPRPSPEAIAFEKRELAQRTEPSRFQRMTGMLRGRPLGQLDRAAKVGNPPVTDRPDASAVFAMNAGPTKNGTGQNEIQLGNLDPNKGLAPQDALPVSTSTTTNSNTADANTSADQKANSTDPQSGEVLPPDEIDKQEQERMLEAEIHRNVPFPHKKKRKKPTGAKSAGSQLPSTSEQTEQ